MDGVPCAVHRFLKTDGINFGKTVDKTARLLYYNNTLKIRLNEKKKRLNRVNMDYSSKLANEFKLRDEHSVNVIALKYA